MLQVYLCSIVTSSQKSMIFDYVVILTSLHLLWLYIISMQIQVNAKMELQITAHSYAQEQVLVIRHFIVVVVRTGKESWMDLRQIV